MHFMTLSELADQIKERRKILNITQEDLSEISGVSLRTLKEIETRKGNPTLETLIKLGDVLGMEVIMRVKSTDKL